MTWIWCRNVRFGYRSFYRTVNLGLRLWNSCNFSTLESQVHACVIKHFFTVCPDRLHPPLKNQGRTNNPAGEA